MPEMSRNRLIAIQPDHFGPNDASSPIWIRLIREAGCEVREVDVRRDDILEQLKGCDGFMWRYGHHPEMRQIARRLLPVVEGQMGLAVYPDQKTCWHFDDKIAQTYLLKAAGIPMPQTWLWFDREQALAWARQAEYPVVLKLAVGAGSSNVRLVESAADAAGWIKCLFEAGVPSLDRLWHLRLGGERLSGGLRLLLKGDPPDPPWELQKNYALFQKFLPGNDFDTRVTIVGNRAFAYRRFNRPGDFRASGSGNFDPDPRGIAPELVRFGFEVASRLKTQSIAIDFLRDAGRPVISEISYAYVSWMVHACPGHWDAQLTWHEGQMWPEKAQVQDFLARLRVQKGRS